MPNNNNWKRKRPRKEKKEDVRPDCRCKRYKCYEVVDEENRESILSKFEEWDEIIRNCRENPTPFKVQNMTTDYLFDNKTATDPYFLKTPKPAIKLKSVRMYKIVSGSPLLYLRDHYGGQWRSCIIRNKKHMPEELTLTQMYTGDLAINNAKIQDLKKLYPYIKPQSRQFFDSLLGDPTINDNQDIDDSDNSSGDEE